MELPSPSHFLKDLNCQKIDSTRTVSGWLFGCPPFSLTQFHRIAPGFDLSRVVPRVPDVLVGPSHHRNYMVMIDGAMAFTPQEPDVETWRRRTDRRLGVVPKRPGEPGHLVAPMDFFLPKTLVLHL